MVMPKSTQTRVTYIRSFISKPLSRQYVSIPNELSSTPQLFNLRHDLTWLDVITHIPEFTEWVYIEPTIYTHACNDNFMQSNCDRLSKHGHHTY